MQHGILVPKIPRLSTRALVLAVVVHCLLIGGLWFGVSWQPKPDQMVSAEVWDVKVREAAPLAAGDVAVGPGAPDVAEKPESIDTQEPVETRARQPEERSVPVPSKGASEQVRPDIALAQERERRRAEQQAAESARREAQLRRQLEQAAADSRRQAEAKRLRALLAAEAGRVAGGGGTAYGRTGTGGSGRSAYSTGPGRADGAYIRRVAAKIKSNTIYNVSSISGNPAVVYDVELFPDGSVRSVRKRSSSGVSGFDEAVRQAVYRSVPYPRDSSGRVPSSFVLTHRPKG